jgi:hypothetical protein
MVAAETVSGKFKFRLDALDALDEGRVKNGHRTLSSIMSSVS